MFIKFRNKSEAIGYLAGIIDGEGYISPHPEVVIVNTNYEIIQGCIEACKILKIDNWFINKGQKSVSKKHKQAYRFIINRKKSLIMLFNLPIYSEKKRKKLEEIIKKIKFSHLYEGEIETVKILRKKGLSFRRIANRMNRNFMTIYRWCKKYKIYKGKNCMQNRLQL